MNPAAERLQPGAWRRGRGQGTAAGVVASPTAGSLVDLRGVAATRSLGLTLGSRQVADRLRLACPDPAVPGPCGPRIVRSGVPIDLEYELTCAHVERHALKCGMAPADVVDNRVVLTADIDEPVPDSGRRPRVYPTKVLRGHLERHVNRDVDCARVGRVVDCCAKGFKDVHRPHLHVVRGDVQRGESGLRKVERSRLASGWRAGWRPRNRVLLEAMRFAQALTVADLPALGANAEHVSRDCKSHVDIARLDEMGKDIAAFANSVGGVIWIGVSEDKKSNDVTGYNPLKQASDAENVRRAYQTAAADYCSPSPLIDTTSLPWQGGYVVAVNVWPFPGQAVGVRDVANQYSFRFPIRLGNQTDFLRAEQLPMLMVPEIRRVSILLRQMTRGDAIEFIGESTRWDGVFGEVRELENVLDLELNVGTTTRPAALPIDAVESVWRDGRVWRIKARHRWALAIDGGTTIRV